MSLRLSRRGSLIIAIVLAVAAAAAWVVGPWGLGARRAAEKAVSLYNQGKYAEALPLLQKAADGGRRDGTIVYQIGYCQEVVEGKSEARQAAWREARTLLEKEVSDPGGATLERLYYLAKINSDEGDFERMRQYALQGVEQFEKGPDANALTGEDWFRLGRMHDFLSEPSESEATYRRSVSAFTRTPDANPIYRALALARVADLDLPAGGFESAAAGYAEALKIMPDSTHVHPFRSAVAFLAAGRHDEAMARFAADRDPDTMTDSQYGADLARKAKDVAPLEAKDADGASIRSLPPEALEQRIKEAGEEFRASRVKHSWKTGDPLSAELVQRQKRFVALLTELLARTGRIQEFCLRQGIADLVRR
jgi:tetratricopeptide (TPR) repeat protein